MKTENTILHASNVATGILVICALTITVLVVGREVGSQTRAETPRKEELMVEDWKGYASQGGHRRGHADAPVTVLVFSDFQCPFCRDIAWRLDTLAREYEDQVAVIYRHFPLRIHPQAVRAVKASECAAREGRFWSFHDVLYQNQDSIGQGKWGEFAAAAGVDDVGAFERCLERDGAIAALSEDTLMANRLKITGTPTLLVNERRFNGAVPLERLREAVERALDAR